MIVELNAKVLAEPNYINLHLDGFDVCFDYDYFSNKSVVTMSHGVSIKKERSDLALRLGFTEMKFFVDLHLLYLRLWQIWNDIQGYMST